MKRSKKLPWLVTVKKSYVMSVAVKAETAMHAATLVKENCDNGEYIFDDSHYDGLYLSAKPVDKYQAYGECEHDFGASIEVLPAEIDESIKKRPAVSTRKERLYHMVIFQDRKHVVVVDAKSQCRAEAFVVKSCKSHDSEGLVNLLTPIVETRIALEQEIE